MFYVFPLQVKYTGTGSNIPTYNFGFTTRKLAPELRYFWKQITEWSACSRTCGNGVQVREYRCLNVLTSNTAFEEQCINAGKPKPIVTRTCVRRSCSIVRTGASVSKVGEVRLFLPAVWCADFGVRTCHTVCQSVKSDTQ